MEQLPELIAANPIVGAQMANLGMEVFYSVYVQRVQDGVAEIVLYVLEVKFGVNMMDVLVLKVTSWLVQDVKGLLPICVGSYQMQYGIIQDNFVYVSQDSQL